MNVGELCIRTVVIGRREERVVDVARRMCDLHVGSVVVVEEQGDRRLPVGIATDRDLLFAVTRDEPRHAEALRLASVMSGDLVVAREDEPVNDALTRMRRRGVRRLPVVDAGERLIGILAYDDLVEWMAEQLGELTAVVDTEQRRERARAEP